jgi:hypothetical protein
MRNLPYCKVLMQTAEFRRMDGIKGRKSNTLSQKKTE